MTSNCYFGQRFGWWSIPLLLFALILAFLWLLRERAYQLDTWLQERIRYVP